MQTAGNFIGVIVKFTASMQHGHDDLCCRYPFLIVHTGWDTTAIILYRNGVIRVDGYQNFFTMTREGFVNSVVHNLEYHVVQTGTIISISDIHARTLTHGIQPF